jgi:hypothetical protein
VREVAAHGPLGSVRIVSGDRLDDLRVLGIRALGPSGQEHRAVLEADELRAERLRESPGRLVARYLEDQAVKLGVGVRDPEQVSAFTEVLHVRDDPAEPGDRDVVGVHRRMPRREALQRRASLKDLHGLALGHTSDRRSAVALALYQPVVLEADEGHPDRRAAEPESRAEILLQQPLTGQQLAADNRLAQILVTVGPGATRAPLGLCAAPARSGPDHGRTVNVDITAACAGRPYLTGAGFDRVRREVARLTADTAAHAPSSNSRHTWYSAPSRPGPLDRAVWRRV